MKKLIIIMLICLSGGATFAQSALSAATATYTAKSTPDTLVNADTSYLYNNSIYTTDYNVGWQCSIANVTGTTGGTVQAQGSDDNVNWYPVIGSATEMTTQTTTVTVSGLTAGSTQAFMYKWPSHQFAYYRVRFISSGTQTSVMTGRQYLRKKVVAITSP